MSFLINDYEADGVDPKLARPVQYGSLRCDDDLNIISEPTLIYCKRSSDHLPQPESFLVHGIAPSVQAKLGMSERDFAKRIHEELNQSQTTSFGFNSVSYDNEMSRHLFFRNFLPPYTHEYAQQCSKWDVLDLVRLARIVLRDKMNWPTTEEGKPSFKLEVLAAANGLNTDRAHDALFDCHLTREICLMIKQHSPALWDYVLNARHKNRVSEIINKGAFWYVSSFHGGEHHYVKPYIKWRVDANNKNAVYCIDISTLCSEQQLKETLDKIENNDWTDLNLPIQKIAINKCPVVLPLNKLDDRSTAFIGYDRSKIESSTQYYEAHRAILDKMCDILASPPEFNDSNVDNHLYNEFISNNDAYRCAQIANNPLPAKGIDLNSMPFEHPSLSELLWRYNFRNSQTVLSPEEYEPWRQHCLDNVRGLKGNVNCTLDEFASELNRLVQENRISSSDDLYQELYQLWKSYKPEFNL